MKLPSKAGFKHAKTRFDDLLAAHQLQGEIVHHTGYFLQFHRLIIYAHETLLQNECNYTGAQPYWDEPSEAGNFKRSNIFSPTTGFGGDGDPSAGVVSWSLEGVHQSAGCITDGPFKDYRLHIGPGMDNRGHCISRNISNSASSGVSRQEVQRCMNMKNFATFWPCLEQRPHSGGHFGVGGEMSNAYSSPGDPLFYLHHCFLDKMYWDWQQQNYLARRGDITGTRLPDNRGGRVKLTDILNMMGVIPNKTIRAVMDTKQLCVEYENPPPSH